MHEGTPADAWQWTKACQNGWLPEYANPSLGYEVCSLSGAFAALLCAKVSLTMAQGNTIRLFDSLLSTGATISPFVWATKYALKHEGFDIEIVPGGFTGIRERTQGIP